MSATIVLSIPWVILWSAAGCTLLGLVLAVVFPSRSEFMGWPVESPGCAGAIVLALGLVLWLIVLGVWIAGGFANGGAS